VRIGCDIGGTKIEVAALDRDGMVRARRRLATPAGDYAATVLAVRDLVAALETEIGTRCTVGVGIPGSLSPASGLVRNANSTCLNGRPLDRDLMAALGRALRFANDANCLALSEATDGAAAGAATVFGVILGTGVGGGLVVDGKLLAGINGIGGEWGHTPLPWLTPEEYPGARCWCGRPGCVETFLSGPALAAAYGVETGERVDAADVAARAADGEAAADRVLMGYEERLARALAAIIDVFDPETIVLGGGVGQIARLYDNVPRRWERHVFSDRVATRLVPPRWGASSGVRGAAWLWSADDAA
jgi:fructokinase